MEITGDFLERAGQLLPLPFKNETLTICNILERSECIDENVTPWKFEPISGQRQAPRRPCFVTSKLQKSSLFKITDSLYKTYAWEKNGDPQQEFKACVEANGLTGLRFEPVWSEEEGIIPYKRPDL